MNCSKMAGAWLLLLGLAAAVPALARADGKEEAWAKIAPFFSPPAQYRNDYGAYKSPLQFPDGHRAASPEEWKTRRAQILAEWHAMMGPWPELLPNPKVEFLSKAPRENFIQHRIKIEVAAGQIEPGWLLIPGGKGPFPAVVVPFYEPETSVGLKGESRDFAYQLAKRGFVALAIGSPGGDARDPKTGLAVCQPLSFLAFIAANAHTALARMPEVDAERIGIVGHSYGGKWAMFASCLYDKFACAAWSDPGIVFDEFRSNVNYWEPWYLGDDGGKKRKPGVITADNPRTGPYKTMIEKGRDLHELHALMAPRPFLVSGGSEDPPERWRALNHSLAVNQLLGATNRVALTTRPAHNPTPESNGQIYLFFEHFLK